jgi:hypothetical protein
MTAFSSTDAAFEGFRLTRERPSAVLVWALAYLVFSLALAIMIVNWFGPTLARFQALQQSANPDLTASVALLGKLAPLYAIAIPLSIVFFATFICAVYRAILRPQDRGLAYFRIGGDEFRMMMLMVVLFLLAMGALFATSIFIGLVVGVLAAVSNPTAGGALAGLIAFVATMWLFVRLSLAGPMTFAERRLVVFGSWSLTRGAFWPLCGAYVLALALGVIILLLMAVIASAIVGVAVFATGGSFADFGRNFQADVSSMRAFLTFPTLVSEVLSAAITTVVYVVILSPAAIAYQGLARARPTPTPT